MEERLNNKAEGEEIVQGYSDDNIPEELGYQIQNLSLRNELVITHYEEHQNFFKLYVQNYMFLGVSFGFG